MRNIALFRPCQEFSSNMPTTSRVNFSCKLRISQYISSETAKVFNINIKLDLVIGNTKIWKRNTNSHRIENVKQKIR